MADEQKVVSPDEEPHEGDETVYKPPPEKSLKEIVEADQEDESLMKYKETLLGDATKEAVIVDPHNDSRVIVKSLVMLVDGRDDLVLDLTGDLDALKKRSYVIKEGIQYRIRIDFYVQREIVTGLRYVQKISRLGVNIEKMSQMVGSYAPKAEVHSYTTPVEDMPSGLMARGTYNVKSLFTDDDKNEHLKWEWTFELKKDWE